MKKSTVISITLLSIFALTIAVNTWLAFDFIRSAQRCHNSVDYTGMDIPALLEEELKSENDFEKGFHSENNFLDFQIPFLVTGNIFVFNFEFFSEKLNVACFNTGVSIPDFIKNRNLRI